MRQLLEIDIDVYSIRLTRHCVVYAFTIQPRRVAPDERTSARKQDQISIGPWSTSSIDPLLFAGRRERFHPRHFPLSFLFTQRTRNNNQINKRPSYIYALNLELNSGMSWLKIFQLFFRLKENRPFRAEGSLRKKSAMKDAVCSRSTRESTQKLGNCPMTADISRPYSKYFNLSVSHTKRARYISKRIKQLFRSWSPVFVRHRFPLLES